MAYQFVTNQTPANYAYCMYNLMQCLYNAGWSIMAWSDGTTAYNTGTIPGPYAAGPGSPDPVFPLTGAFPNAGSNGAGGLNNNQAWFVVRQPKTPASASFAPVYGGTRMLVFQRGNADYQWRMKYSVSGRYQFASQGGTTPSLYGTATNQDDVTWFGGGTDASPSFTTLFGDQGGNDGTTRFNCAANDGKSGETSPFGFWCSGFRNGGGVYPSMGIVFDPMAAGTIGIGEQDPYIIFSQGDAGATFQSNIYSSGLPNDSGYGAACWLKYGNTAVQQFVRILGAIYYTYRGGGGVNIAVPGTASGYRGTIGPLGVNPFNNNDDLFPVVMMRPAYLGGLTGYKGVCSVMKWNSVPRSCADTQAQNTIRDRIIQGDVSLPWDGSVPLI